MPSAFARLSRCFHTLAGKRTERGTVGPVSVPFRGLPRPAWMEIPSAAMRSAYGLRRTLPLSKFTSGISRSAARDGSRGFLPVAFFIALPLMRCSAPCADDADQVLTRLDEDRDQNASFLRLTHQNRPLRVHCILQHRREGVREHRSGLLEGDTVLPEVQRGLLRVPREPHRNKCNTLCRTCKDAARPARFGQPVVSSRGSGTGSTRRRGPREHEFARSRGVSAEG